MRPLHRRCQRGSGRCLLALGHQRLAVQRGGGGLLLFGGVLGGVLSRQRVFALLRGHFLLATFTGDSVLPC
jgi:hypothetical protein